MVKHCGEHLKRLKLVNVQLEDREVLFPATLPTLTSLGMYVIFVVGHEKGRTLPISSLSQLLPSLSFPSLTPTPLELDNSIVRETTLWRTSSEPEKPLHVLFKSLETLRMTEPQTFLSCVMLRGMKRRSLEQKLEKIMKVVVFIPALASSPLIDCCVMYVIAHTGVQMFNPPHGCLRVLRLSGTFNPLRGQLPGLLHFNLIQLFNSGTGK